MTDQSENPDPATRLVLTKDYSDSPDTLADLVAHAQEELSDEKYRLTLTLESESLDIFSIGGETGESKETDEPEEVEENLEIFEVDPTVNPSKPPEPSKPVKPTETSEPDEPAEPETREVTVGDFGEGDTVVSRKDGYGKGTVASINETYGTVVVDFANGVTRAHEPDALDHLDDVDEVDPAPAPDPTPTPDEEDAEDDEEGELDPGSRAYRIASTVSALTRDGDPTQTREIAEALTGTPWAEADRDYISKALLELRKNDLIDPVGRGDYGAITYSMTLTGEAAVAHAEEHASQTFEDVTTDTEPEPEPDTDPEPEPDTEPEPEPDTDPEPEKEIEIETDDADPLTERVTVNPRTWKFKIGTTLLNRDGPQTPADIEDALAGTEWEKGRNHISGTLGGLYNEDVADRENVVRAENQTGPTPFEYHLTDEGREFLETVESEAVDAGEQTYTDVVDADGEDDVEEADDDTENEDDEDADDRPECHACGTDLPESWSEESKDGENYPPDCPACGENPLPPVGSDGENEDDDADPEPDEPDAPADKVDVDPGDLFADPDTDEPTGLDALFGDDAEGETEATDGGTERKSPGYLDDLERALEQTEETTL